MTNGTDPSWRNRLAARRAGEVSTAQLEAFRRAGSGVFEVTLLADDRRRELAAAGQHPWSADAATTSLLLCAWNARVHQTLATSLLDSDLAQDPRTAGFVPAVTFRQVWSLFAPVQSWVSAARRAAANPDFWIGEQVELPSPLPRLLSPGTPAPKFVRGMLTAGDTLDQLLEQALGEVLLIGEPPEPWRGHARRIAEMAAHAQSALQYGQGLWHPAASPELDAVILGHVLPALVLAHHLGQFLALPELADRYRVVGDGTLTPTRRRPWRTPQG